MILLDFTPRSVRSCAVTECESPAKTRGLCGMHAERVRAHGTTDLPEREKTTRPPVPDTFETFFTRGTDDECWEWRGARTDAGYGTYRGGYAHRVGYERGIGAIPDGMQLDHLCRSRSCVNPSHLEAVSQRENILRGTSPSAANAQKTHCVNKHEFTPENTYLRPDGGGRQCRACARKRRLQRAATQCQDCGGGTTCDEACPSAAAVERESVLAEIDAWEDHQATTNPDERAWAS